MAEVLTCPKCGALITRELERCRRCNTYLHGTALEGALITNLLPEALRARPGTASIALVTLLYYVMMVVLVVPTEPRAVFGFSGFSLIQLGATHGGAILVGEWWRFVTSIFAHHDPLHLAFNVWALASAGPIVEELFDRKKMLLMYLISGVLSMVVSFFWYVYARDQVSFVSAGASGAVSGLVGAALFGARRRVLDGQQVARSMLMWSISLVAWGVIMPNVNNAAHFGGWAVGALFGRFAPLGTASSVAVHRLLSVVMVGCGAVVVGSMALMFTTLRGMPTTLEAHAVMQYMPMFMDPEGGGRGPQPLCLRGDDDARAVLRDCQIYLRVANNDPTPYLAAARALTKLGQSEEAQRYLLVAHRLNRFVADRTRDMLDELRARGIELQEPATSTTAE